MEEEAGPLAVVARPLNLKHLNPETTPTLDPEPQTLNPKTPKCSTPKNLHTPKTPKTPKPLNPFPPLNSKNELDEGPSRPSAGGGSQGVAKKLSTKCSARLAGPFAHTSLLAEEHIWRAHAGESLICVSAQLARSSWTKPMRCR